MTDHSAKILLIDDNEDDRLLMLRSIRKSGSDAEVVALKDGIEALDYLKGITENSSGEETPDVVFLDLNMPKIDGFEILEKIRSGAATKNLPVVILSTSNDKRDVARSYELGANSFVRKPVDSQTFADTINQLRSYWLEVNLTTHS